MNKKLVVNILGYLMCFMAGFLLLPCIISLCYRESEGIYYLYTAIGSGLVGFLLTRIKPTKRTFYARDGFASVSLCWVVMALVGCIPFMLTGEIPFFVDALFETVSGFTTTGASILTNVEALSHTSLFWRSFTHWIGGMGVLVFILAIIPLSGASNIMLMKAESPGPITGKLVPKVKTTAFYLYLIYFALTVIEIIILLICKMPLFDAMTLSFGTAGTGGFAIKNSGLADYSYICQTVVAVFMLLFGVNFSLYYLIITKKFKEAFSSEELRSYAAIVLVAVICITIDSLSCFTSAYEALHMSFFHVASIMTTTGFGAADFNQWHSLSKTILICLMFIGAMGGSTGGGVKVSRVIIAFKSAVREIDRCIHPKRIKGIMMDKRELDDGTVRAVGTYFLLYIFVFFISLLIISANGYDFTTNFAAVAATLNNIGPGLELVGPTSNFSFFSAVSKIVFILDMLIGRLELYPVLVLFLPSLYRQ